ncbi:asparagine synthase (glutamine-hydrolyzing) [Butyrivibrio sp. FC2001]|uniref:asparagine synthase (glutamine-hydrolyzing) n=1 Tax=Butyrivibrio sp. FC2001 TaxID=1280671 RepID=UPI000423C72F|nr:asparagine synthase (glutamine-hydrolyzing) [Butyrivibrio sp. FC2001]
MCGICGYISKNKCSDEILNRMNDTMIHRGPNDHGIAQIVDSSVYVGLAQRRLSILDLTSLGHQPMYSQSGKTTIIFNGEIYNFKKIREELIAEGMTFNSNCDTEVILGAYELYGSECVKMFNGMFAFAIYDKTKHKLFIARDRMGKKPFYYYSDLSKPCFIFGSTLQPIMQHPEFNKEVSKEALYEFMYYGYITEPRSIFSGVYKLEPGHTLEVDLTDFHLKNNCYWNLYDSFVNGRNNLFDDYEIAKQSLKDTLVNSVRNRMISDVPLGTFLSGGIDSSLVSAIAQSISSNKINTYSIGFADKKFDESQYAEEISRYIGTNHHSVIVNEDDLIEMTEQLSTYYDEPFADSSQLPSMLVSSLAKKDITVVLTGDGGDELFCGYEGYDNILKIQKYRRLGKYLKPFSKNLFIQSIIPTRILSVVNASEEDRCQWISVAQKRTADSVLNSILDDVRYDESWLAKEIPIQNRRMMVDMKYYLPGDILHKVDRASMKYSLESRCPLLDYNVVSTSFRIPLDYMYKDGIKKYILKDILYDYIPKELLDRPKKGFSVPLMKILRTNRVKEMIRLTSDASFIHSQGLFNFEGIQQIMRIVYDDNSKVQESIRKNAVNMLWNYYVFQNWYITYIGK